MSLAQVPIADGAEFSTPAYVLDREKHLAYGRSIDAPPRRRPPAGIHDDPAAAAKAGYAAPIADGEQVLALAARLLCEHFGIGFLRGGRIDVAFIKPVYFGTQLTARARVTRVGDGAADLEVWVENRELERVMAGAATVRIDSR
ncbi:MAG: MaoC family dehydratase [Candidatus Binataceae bacterium]